MSKSSYLLNTLGQESHSLTVDPFIIDFCEIWEVIHQYVKNLPVKKITKTAEIAITLKDEYTLPFYEKYGHYQCIDCFPGWLDRLATIFIRFCGGRITFPLRLIMYELVNFKDQLLQKYLTSLVENEIEGTREKLFAYLFPKLSRMVIPLSSSDVTMLQSFQLVHDKCGKSHIGPTTREFIRYIPTLTPDTIRNKLEQMVYFQMVANVFFLDMGRLGYETFLLSHSTPLPSSFENYCLTNVHFGSNQYSIIQLPYSEPTRIVNLRDQLTDESGFRPFYSRLTKRIHTWNLSRLQKGTNNWISPFSFFYSDLDTTPSILDPIMDLSLDPSYDPYRRLTQADIELLTFLTTIGEATKIKDFSDQLNLHRHTVTRLLQEYHKERLLHKVVQFSNLGINLPISFFLDIPNSLKSEFKFLTQIQTLPKVDIFLADTEDSTIYFGRVSIPHNWMYDFASRMKLIRDTFPDITLLYTNEPPILSKWNLSLKNTYPKQD